MSLEGSPFTSTGRCLSFPITAYRVCPHRGKGVLKTSPPHTQQAGLRVIATASRDVCTQPHAPQEFEREEISGTRPSPTGPCALPRSGALRSQSCLRRFCEYCSQNYTHLGFVLDRLGCRFTESNCLMCTHCP